MASKVIIKKKKKTILLSPDGKKKTSSPSSLSDTDSPNITIPSSQSKSNNDPEANETKELPPETLTQIIKSSVRDAEHQDEPDSSDSAIMELISADTEIAVPKSSEQDSPTFKFHCYRCGQRLKVPVAWAKMMIECGCCERKIVIPAPRKEDV